MDIIVFGERMHRKFIKALGLVILSTLLFTSCGTKTSNTTFKFVSGAFNITALSENFNGGALIIGRNKLGQEKFQLAISPDNTQEIETELPFGDYEVIAIGWHDTGLSPGVLSPGMEGTTYCELLNTKIDSNSTAIQLALSQANCSNEPFASSILSDSPDDQLNIEFCHGIVQHPNEGRRDECKDAKAPTESYEIEYLSLDADGIPIPELTLKSACIDNATYQSLFSTATRKPFVNFDPIKFNSPVRVRAYLGSGCTDITNSYSVLFPKSLATSASNYGTFYKKAPQKVDFPVTGSNLLVGVDSCSTPNALIGPNVSGTWKASGQNIICTTAQFNGIPDADISSIMIGKTLDFQGAQTTQAANNFSFKGRLEGDFTIKMNNLPHIKGLKSNLFGSFGVAGGDSNIRDLNINVSTITDGPVIAREAFGNIEIEHLQLFGEMTNNTSNDLIINTGPTYSSGCGGLFNTYDPTAGGQSFRLRNLEFQNFKLNCQGFSPTSDLAIGGAIGSIHSENTADTDHVEFQVEQIKGSVTIANVSQATDSLGGLFGQLSKGINFRLQESDIAFNYTGDNSKNIGGYIGKISNGQNFEYGYFQLDGSSTIVNINSTKVINGQEAVGSLIGWAYNSSSLELHNMHTDGVITSRHKNAGGLIGYAGNYEYDSGSQYFELTIRNSINSTDVTGGQFVGGIVGATDSNYGVPNERGSLLIENSVSKGYIKSLGKTIGNNYVASGGVLGCAGCASGQIGKIKVQNFLNMGTSKTYLEAGGDIAAASPLIGIAKHTENLASSEACFDITNSQYINKSSIDTNSAAGSETFIQVDSAIEYIDNTSLEAVNNWVFNFDNIVCPHCNGSTVLTNIKTSLPMQTLDNYTAELDSSYITDFSTNDFFNASGDLVLSDLINSYYVESVTHGTRSKPFKLSQSSNLELLSNNPVAPNLSWKMVGNIDMSTQHLQLSPSYTPFRGTFDGGGHTISNFSNDYRSQGLDTNGIFPKVEYGEIRNLNISGGTYEFDCDIGGNAGALIGSINHSEQYQVDRPFFENISIDHNIINSSSSCSTLGLFAGLFNTFQSVSTEALQLTDNISIKNNQIYPIDGSLYIDKISFQVTNNKFGFRNIELLNNQFVNTPMLSGAFFSQANQNFNTEFSNTLYVGHQDGKNPTDIFTPSVNNGTNTKAGDNYVFLDIDPDGVASSGDEFTGSIDFGLLSGTNSSAYFLTDIAATMFGKYFIKTTSPVSVRLNRELIQKEIENN